MNGSLFLKTDKPEEALGFKAVRIHCTRLSNNAQILSLYGFAGLSFDSLAPP
jgi:hypothetical protein